MFDTVVRVRIGKDDTTRIFELHRGVLCFYSGYFQSALNGSFVEAQKGEVTLETEDPDIFKLFHYWIYTKRFTSDTGTKDQTALSWQTLFNLWVFGDAHQIPLFQNTAADILVKKALEDHGVPTGYIPFVYENTLKTSKLRLLVMDLVGRYADAEKAVDDCFAAALSTEQLLDLLTVVWQKGEAGRELSELAKQDMCQYHVHEEGARCPDTGSAAKKA